MQWLEGPETQVTHTGKGIDPAVLTHIFEPFWQGTVPRAHREFGLGFPIARMFVEAHGGRVEVESEGAGRGRPFEYDYRAAPRDAAVVLVESALVPCSSRMEGVRHSTITLEELIQDAARLRFP